MKNQSRWLIIKLDSDHISSQDAERQMQNRMLTGNLNVGSSKMLWKWYQEVNLEQKRKYEARVISPKYLAMVTKWPESQEHIVEILDYWKKSKNKGS